MLALPLLSLLAILLLLALPPLLLLRLLPLCLLVLAPPLLLLRLLLTLLPLDRQREALTHPLQNELHRVPRQSALASDRRLDTHRGELRLKLVVLRPMPQTGQTIDRPATGSPKYRRHRHQEQDLHLRVFECRGLAIPLHRYCKMIEHLHRLFELLLIHFYSQIQET